MTRWVSVAITWAVTLAACQPGEEPGAEYMPDMARGPAYKAFAPNQAMRNGITLQRPVAGTIARGATPFHYGKGDAEGERAGRELVNPHHPTPATLEKGKALYQTYCAVCHGDQGKGDGPIAAKIPPPPSYKSERLIGFAPGRIYQVITVGSNKMPSYAVQLAPDDRWLVITYVRAVLQGLPEAMPAVPPPSTPTPTTTAPAAPPPSTPTPTPAAQPPSTPTPAAPTPARRTLPPAAPTPAPHTPSPTPAAPAGGTP